MKILTRIIAVLAMAAAAVPAAVADAYLATDLVSDQPGVAAHLDPNLVNGPGEDTLVGSGARDILIGGEGPDHLRGLGDDDLIIGGMTFYDSSIPALMQILAVWTSANSYAARIDQLRNGTGGVPKVDATTVVDDGPVDQRPDEQVN